MQPYIALCAQLRRMGHQVRLASHAEFEPLIRDYDLEFHDIQCDPRAIMGSELGQTMLGSGKNGLRFLRTFGQLIAPVLEVSLQQAHIASQDADGIINGNFGMIANRLSQEAAPYCAVCLQPFTATNASASPFFPSLPGGHLGYNKLTHHLFAAFFWQFMGMPLLNAQRRLKMPLPNARTSRAAQQRELVCYAYSPSLLPPPKEMPKRHHVTGFCFLDHAPSWQPPPALVDFLAAGPPPVYIGFGSMRNKQPEETAMMAISALQRAGQRGILMQGWGGMTQTDVPDDIMLLDAVPHDWLFPRMRAVVHHGGAGTTAAGVRAGVPSIIIPFFSDQPFWARTVYLAGVSPRPIPRAQLTTERLSAAISAAVTDQAMAARAVELGQRIDAEHGEQVAARMIEAYFSK